MTNCYSVFRIVPYFKSSESVVSENNHALPENIVRMYSNFFLNSKFKFLRKCQNKSVCVRRFLRCIKTIAEVIEIYKNSRLLNICSIIWGHWRIYKAYDFLTSKCKIKGINSCSM